MLTALGSGVGLASVSPWSGTNPSPTTVTALIAIWLIVMQWLSSGIGGYLTGRLRTKWVGTHTHEVFFRDTAHGFLTWAVASIVVVVLSISGLSSIVSSGVQTASHVASGVVTGATQGVATNQSGGSNGYLLDTLFRSDQPSAGASPSEVRSEATGILSRAVTSSAMDPGDRTYLTKLIVARTGVSQADAEKRIDNAVTQVKAAEQKARDAADASRKAASSLSFFTFFSMLIGAFVACVAAAIGGGQRDEL